MNLVEGPTRPTLSWIVLTNHLISLSPYSNQCSLPKIPLGSPSTSCCSIFKELTAFKILATKIDIHYNYDLVKYLNNPGKCGSLGWVSSHKSKHSRFNSQSEHMPRLQVWSPVRVGSSTKIRKSMFLSLSFSLPFSLKSKPMSSGENKKKIPKHLQYFWWLLMTVCKYWILSLK